MEVKDILNKLNKVKQTGKNQYIALCPAHDDRNPSLSISEDNGTILMHCHANCSIDNICRSIGIESKHLFNNENKAQKPLPPIKETTKEVERYNYSDENGEILYYQKRLVYQQSGRKTFRSVGIVNGGEVYSLNGIRRVIYNLPSVISAVQNGETIYIVEGEKDANNLIKIGLTATTNIGGAGSWLKEYNSHFVGADVIIIPDNDKAGFEHAKLVYENLQSIAKSIKVVIWQNY